MMIDELKIRRKFAAAQMFVGLVTSLFYAMLVFNISIISSLGTFVYWFILPYMVFVLIAAMALSRDKERFKVSFARLWGAAIGVYLVFAPPIFLWGIFPENFTGGFTFALLAYVAPVVAPIFMIIGWFFGEIFEQK